MEVIKCDRAIERIKNNPYNHPKYRKYKLFTWGKVLEEKK